MSIGDECANIGDESNPVLITVIIARAGLAALRMDDEESNRYASRGEESRASEVTQEQRAAVTQGEESEIRV